MEDVRIGTVRRVGRDFGGGRVLLLRDVALPRAQVVLSLLQQSRNDECAVLPESLRRNGPLAEGAHDRLFDLGGDAAAAAAAGRAAAAPVGAFGGPVRGAGARVRGTRGASGHRSEVGPDARLEIVAAGERRSGRGRISLQYKGSQYT